MTNAKKIELARSYLPVNPGAYARVMSSFIRGAMSDRTAAAMRKAIKEDNKAWCFLHLETGRAQSAINAPCPSFGSY